MHLIDRHGLGERIRGAPPLHPRLILPGVPIDIADHRGGLRPDLELKAVWIGFDHQVAGPILDLIFIFFAHPDLRDEQLPDARPAEHPHLMLAAVPLIEIADHTDVARVRRPDGEIDSVHAVDGRGMAAEFFINGVVIPLAEQIEIQLAQLRQKKIRVMHKALVTVLRDDVQLIVRQLIPFRNLHLEKVVAVHRVHGKFAARSGMQHRGGAGVGNPGADHPAVLALQSMGTENDERIVQKVAGDLIDLFGGHGRLIGFFFHRDPAR
ncbi:MAG: hypothetical protein BWY83_02531 [bacterium ADurb.Bin478]|nr:MAG: hypothetical protein BWY83_02531 [bacterium ADurb.Bin478]